MKRSWRWAVVVAAVGALALSACSGDDDDDDSASSDTTAATEQTTAASSDTTAAADETTAAADEPSPYKATADPTTGLTDGATVNVSVEGFTAGKHLGINQCASTNDSEVGAEDCNLEGIAVLTVDADGTGTGTINVKASGIGSNAHDCLSPDTRCFLSVGELVEDPNAERSDDIDLTFTS
jgi:hypothetical protein